ncbi:MAG: O-antigen ligase family protein [Thermodesulfobacteria bacterium]|nr:O-antigen ligase family protein [Thermodesulfobacteriota bacterium]
MDDIARSGTCRELWFVIPFLLFIFYLATPYNLSWPRDVEYKKNIIQVNEAISRMERGNIGRRAGLVILAAFGVFLLARTRNRFRINGLLGLLLIVYVLWSVLSLLWSIDQMFTLRRLVTFLILWFAAIAMAARYSIKELAIIGFCICGITGLLGFANEIRLHTLDPFNESWRFSGVFHTVTMGWNCGLWALCSFYLATISSSRGAKAFFYGAMMVALVLLLLTKSRMAVASTFICLTLFWFMVSSARTILATVMLALVVLCSSYLVLGDKVIEYGEAATTLGRGESARESVGTLTGRLPLWKECFRWAVKRPILGYGFNTFISPKHYVEITKNVGWTPSSIHSGYIDALMGLGFVGLSVLLGVLAAALFRAFTLAKNNVSYTLVFCCLIWLCYNIFLEANLLIRPTFMTFVMLMFLAHLAFLPAERAEAGI